MTPNAVSGAFETPLVTIILTTCDRPALLERAIESVIRQDDPRWALIVVDDGLESSPWRAPHDSRICRIRTSGRVGAAEARNIGITQVKSEWMILLDDDDEMEEGHIAHFIENIGAMADVPAFALTDWRVLDYGQDGEVEHERRRTYDLTSAPSPQNIHQALRAGACGLAINQGAIARAGPMDPSYAFTEDTEWILRLIEAGCQIRYASGPGFIIHNRRTTDQMSSKHHFAARISECIRLKTRYGDLNGRFPGLGNLFDGLIGNYGQRA